MCRWSVCPLSLVSASEVPVCSFGRCGIRGDECTCKWQDCFSIAVGLGRSVSPVIFQGQLPPYALLVTLTTKNNKTLQLDFLRHSTVNHDKAKYYLHVHDQAYVWHHISIRCTVRPLMMFHSHVTHTTALPRTQRYQTTIPTLTNHTPTHTLSDILYCDLFSTTTILYLPFDIPLHYLQ